MHDILWYAAWVIFPLIPSILLFLILPKNRASVNYATKGLEIKLGGAVALFFLLFYFMNPVKLKLIKTDFAQDNWKLIASFKDQSDQTIPVTQIVRIEAIPNWETPLDHERIMVTLPAVEKKKDNKLTIPYMLRFTFADYEARTISAAEYFNKDNFCEIQWDDQQICLKNLPKLVVKKKQEQKKPEQQKENEVIAAREQVIN